MAGSLASEPLTNSRSVGRHVPGQHDYIRVDVELVQLLNPQGVAATGKACDLSGACDPVITAYLDMYVNHGKNDRTQKKYASYYLQKLEQLCKIQ